MAEDILGLRNRLDRIETQIRAISHNLGIPYDDGTAAIPPEVVELVRADQRLQAIRRYSELTGAVIVASSVTEWRAWLAEHGRAEADGTWDG